MTSQFIDAHCRNGILEVLINRVEKRNALSQAVLMELREVFESNARDDSIIAATLRGGGDKCFAAGGDLVEFDSLRERDAVARMGQVSYAALDAIRNFPVPVIALLNGDAIGGGAELAVACDMRVFAAHSRIAFVQGSMCISPAWGGGADLVRLVGSGRALRLLSRAEFVSANDAYALGLADAVTPSDQSFDVYVQEFISPITQRKPQVMRAFKAITAAARAHPHADKIQALEAECLLTTWLHPDHWAASDATIARISKSG